MTDEISDSHTKVDSKEQAEAQERINDAGRRARLIIKANNLLSAFGIRDLSNPEQKLKEVLLEVFIQEQLLADDVGRKLSRRSIEPSEKALELVVAQNGQYASHPEDYPGAGNIRFAVQALFEMVHEKTGKSIDPERPIDKRIIPRWKERFS